MNIAIVIPTYKRIDKLKRCLYSLSNQTYEDFSLYLYCDNNDKETYNYFADSPLNTWTQYSAIKKIIVNEKQEFVIGSWNKFFSQEFINSKHDAVAWIVDDTELYPDCLEKTVEAMKINFPDYDGVVGIQQECPGHISYSYKPFGQVLIGRKFIERYKEVDYQVCAPDYKHFHQDEELWMYANSLNKFVLGEGRLKHYHPAFIKEEVDETHPIVRGAVMRQDKATFQLRREKNLIWGQTFERVNQ